LFFNQPTKLEIQTEFVIFFRCLIDELIHSFCRCRYLVDTRWFKKLKRFLGRWSQAFGVWVNPGPIDNYRLFDWELKLARQEADLNNSRSQGKDFVLVPEEAWIILRDEFGLHPGQEPLARKVRQ
jgi:ubiquitin carboxyl-terminal hydrolase 4/11/15